MIRVVNRHVYKGPGIYIGRGTIFGNPYSHKGYRGTIPVNSREEAIERYKYDKRQQWEDDEEFRNKIIEFAILHNNGVDLYLICSCAPKPCHGDVLKVAIENTAEDISDKKLLKGICI